MRVVTRHGAGYYTITTADGAEWDVSLRHDSDVDGNERASTYWMATDSNGGYIEAQTLREIKRILSAPTRS